MFAKDFAGVLRLPEQVVEENPPTVRMLSFILGAHLFFRCSPRSLSLFYHDPFSRRTLV